MQCKICGGNFKNLGVHVQKKHMPCDDYRRQFDIPLTAPLADADLCELFSVSALQRLEDPAWLEQCKNACAANSKAIKGKKTGPLNLPPVSKKRLIEMNKETGESYRQRMVPIVRADYMAGLTPIEIKRKHGVAAQTLKDWERMGLLPVRRLRYAFARGGVRQRNDVAVFAKQQLRDGIEDDGDPYKYKTKVGGRKKGNCVHYGKQELRDLLDFIYSGPPSNDSECVA